MPKKVKIIEIEKKKSNITNVSNGLNPSHKINKGIWVAAAILVVLIIAFIALGPSFTQPTAGKATYYAAEVGNTAAGQWGLTDTEIEVGEPWHNDFRNRDEKDVITVRAFVDFAQAADFHSFRLRMHYNPAILEVGDVGDVRPLQNLYSAAAPGYPKIDVPGEVTVLYVFSGNAAQLAARNIQGKKNLFEVDFTVIGDRGDDDAEAVWFEAVNPVVLNNDAGQQFGVYRSTDQNIDVQMINANPNPAALNLIIHPPCEDKDGDGYAGGGVLTACRETDRNTGGVELFDTIDCVDDRNLQDASGNVVPAERIYPGAVEVCNNIDDNCNDLGDGLGVDDGLDPLQMGFNSQPGGGPLLGVCLGYKECIAGVPTNSYEGSMAALYDANPEAGQCDNLDNNCNGEVDEQLGGAVCEFGGGDGVNQLAGNLLMDFDNNAYRQIQQVDGLDFNILFYLKDFDEAGRNPAIPYCQRFAQDYLCICKDGNHYYRTIGDDGQGAVPYSYVNYALQTQEQMPLGYEVRSEAGELVLYDDQGVGVQC